MQPASQPRPFAVRTRRPIPLAARRRLAECPHQRPGDDSPRHATPALLSSRTQIARDDEPGDRLVVNGQVFAPDGRTPAPGVTVYAYNTDRQGYYGENRKEYPPRIYGWMKTGPAGRFELLTVRPGNYPRMQVPAHIHFELWGAGYPLQWTEELKIAGDRFLTRDAFEKDSQLGDFRTIRPLTRARDNLLRCAFQIRLQRTTNFH